MGVCLCVYVCTCVCVLVYVALHKALISLPQSYICAFLYTLATYVCLFWSMCSNSCEYSFSLCSAVNPVFLSLHTLYRLFKTITFHEQRCQET